MTPSKTSSEKRYLPFLNKHYTGILKIILVKGSHGLENVRLNLFSVTISSVRKSMTTSDQDNF
jgi:hypothetical protein